MDPIAGMIVAGGAALLGAAAYAGHRIQHSDTADDTSS